MRKVTIAPGEYYHLYNRGVNKQNIFIDERDWVRLLFLILYLQSSLVFNNIGRQVTYYIKRQGFNIDNKDLEEIQKNRTVKIVSFAIMPNHFHLLVTEIKKGGIPHYMQRIQNGYTKYFNTKYKKSGHLLQGPYQAVHVENNRQLLHLSTYIHKNPTEIKHWHNKEHKYPWSSYSDYTSKNRWGKLLTRDIILGQFKNPKEYLDFIKTSPAKSLNKEILIDC
ncbi:MAG: transposase [Parcubacteria group bacterium]|nr:transposase [Parcubacteria group bacterium]